MAPSGSCSGIEGTGWGWTCLLKPFLRHFFGGGKLVCLISWRRRSTNFGDQVAFLS